MGHIGPIEFHIDPDRRVVHMVSHANPTVEEWIATLDSILADPGFRPGFGFLSDRRAVAEPASSALVHAGTRYLHRYPEVFSRARWAVVIETVAGFGMTRMAQALSEESGLVVQIFKEPDAALAWLAEGASAAASASS